MGQSVAQTIVQIVGKIVGNICYKRGINESPRGDSLFHNDEMMTWTNVNDCAARAICLVITLTHMNYKLLVLYSICYRVYTRSQIINYM